MIRRTRCQITRQPSRRLKALCLFSFIFAASCSDTQTPPVPETDSEETSDSQLVITKVSPVKALAGDTLTLTGENFDSAKKYVVAVMLKDGTEVEVPVNIRSSTAGAFTMPPGVGLGLKSVRIKEAGMAVTSVNIIAYDPTNSLPIITATEDQVCEGKIYINKDGLQVIGTKDCAGSTSAPVCTSDGQQDCLTDASYVAADAAVLASTNIIKGVSLGGISGTFNAICSSGGQQNCVTTGSYFAATECTDTQSNCYIKPYVATNQPLKAVNYDDLNANASLIRTTLSVGGITGTLASCSAYGIGCVTNASYLAGSSSALIASNIVNTATINGIIGTLVQSPAACSSNGAQNCVASSSYLAGTACAANGSNCYLPAYATSTQPMKAINFDDITASAGNLRAGTSISTVNGTLADCSANGTAGCVAVTAYKSGDLTNLSTGNIKKTVTIGGVSGNYPSAAFRLPSASNATDLSSTGFASAIATASSFEFWTSEGSYQSVTGDSDLADGNIKSGVDIFGYTGTYVGVSIDPWDLRAGTTVGTVTGKLPVNCRNGSNLLYFDQAAAPVAVQSISLSTVSAWGHGLADNEVVRFYYNTAPSGLSLSTNYYVISTNTVGGTFQISTVANGSAVTITSAGPGWVYKVNNSTAEYWDTISDESISISADTISCGGIESTPGDDNVWEDVGSCSTSSANCSLRDKISKTEWSLPAAGTVTWTAAASYCDTLDYNSKSDWRLPTQKEIMEASVHGFKSTAGYINWLSTADTVDYYWSATTDSSTTSKAWLMSPGSGHAISSAKTGSYETLCVRP